MKKWIYRISTWVLSAMLLMSAMMYLTGQVSADLASLGYTAKSFAIVLGTLKLLEALAISIPHKFYRLREWSYAGLGINFLWASIAHIEVGHGAQHIMTPLVMFGVLAVSYFTGGRSEVSAAK